MAGAKKQTEDAVLNEVEKVIDMLRLTRVPTHDEMEMHSLCGSSFRYLGGSKWASKKLGMPTATEAAAWTEDEVLAELKRLQKKLHIYRVPTHGEIKAHSKCLVAFRRFGGTKWAAERLGVDTYIREHQTWTFDSIVAEVKRVMDELDIHDRMPSYTEIAQVSTCYGSIKRVGGSKAIAEAIGVPCARKRKKPTSGDRTGTIKKSNAFEKQRVAAKPYGQLQKEETLAMVGTIDLSQYSGMKTYAERTAVHG